MPATSVGGMPTTDTIVSTLNSSFCAIVTKPRTASSRNCTFRKLRLEVVERDHILRDRAKAALELRCDPGMADVGREMRDPSDAEQRIASQGEAVADVAALTEREALRAIATRYEKTASSFMGVLCLAAA